MLKNLYFFTFLLVPMVLVNGCGSMAKVDFAKGPDGINVTIDGMYFTTYRYGGCPYNILPGADKHDGGFLTKPVLHPMLSPSGVVVTRGYPLIKVEGESADHPHHVGLFFTYGSEGEVNGENFWSTTAPGSMIKHIKITKMESARGRGELSTISHWQDKNAKVLLVEKRDMLFHAGKNQYIIDFSIDLTAQKEKIVFGDTKEGMFAVRVAPWLRETAGSNWVKAITGTAEYLNSDGRKTEKNVWARRVQWMRLEGTKDDKKVGIAVLNHPSSVNYPTYWHARGYGLFSANPLGQYAFQKGTKEKNPEPFNLTLQVGETAHFGFRVIIYEGSRTKEQLDKQFDDYSEK